MSGHSIGVVGAGIVGLSTAINVQARLPHARVTIYADKFGADTTSHGSGGLFRPNLDHLSGDPETVTYVTVPSSMFLVPQRWLSGRSRALAL